MRSTAATVSFRSIAEGEEAVSDEVDPERAGREEARPRRPDAAAAVEVVEDDGRPPLLPAPPRRLRRAVAVVQRRHDRWIPAPRLDLEGPAPTRRRTRSFPLLPPCRSLLLPLLLR